MSHPFRSFVALIAFAALAACGSPGPEIDEPAPEPEAELRTDAYVVDVTAIDYAFRAPETIPSGWVTFRMNNDGEETHFMVLHRLPEGHTYDEYVGEVAPGFGEVWTPYAAGEIDRAAMFERLGGAFPGWFWEVRQMGGPGLVAPGGVARATMRLEPGTYVLECYMKTAEGVFHGEEGMLRELVVTAAEAGASQPAADVRIEVSEAGFDAGTRWDRGLQTVAVEFGPQPEGFGNDVNIVRLEPGMEAADLLPWMDWSLLEGMKNPAPATFVGGIKQMPEGHTGYFTVRLEPGRYAWVSDAPQERGMAREFTVRR